MSLAQHESFSLNQEVLTTMRARVVIADDDDDVRQLLKLYLGDAGYDVVEVANGALLHDIVAASYVSPGEPPDLIITDIRMPGYTGLEVLADLRRVDWALPVVLISGYDNPGSYDEAARLGAAAFLRKPIDRMNLLNIVRRMVAPRV